MPRFLTYLVLALVLASFGAGRAHADGADSIALLPFDADHKLEIYGQPVASELARALGAGKIDVVLVGRKMAVPERARLIVDGMITSGKGATVVLTVRVRSSSDGTVLATMDATAPTLANIDKAAAELSARVLSSVRQQLDAARPPPVDGGGRPVEPVPPVVGPTSALRPMLVSFAAKEVGAEPLRGALPAAVASWAHNHRREPTPLDPGKLSKQLVTQTVKASGNDLAIGFEVLSYAVEAGPIPLARARVRVRISDAVGIVFDRVITTDTVVGDRALPLDQLAARTAREVVDIMRPHVKRTVAGWR